MSDEDSAGISDESKDLLQGHVRKGKACKFFLLTKGSGIQTLGVFRKGTVGSKVMAARKLGFKGDVTSGVVTGAGNKLFFQLAGNNEVAAAMKIDEANESPPVTAAKLKEFLKANELSVQPTFHVITNVANAVDAEREQDVPLPPPPPGSEVADAKSDDEPVKTETKAPPPPPPLPGSPEAEFARRLKTLRQDLDRVLAANVAASPEAKLRASEAATYARKKDFQAANSVLDQVEKLVAQGLEQMRSRDASAKPTSGTTDDAAKFKRRLETLVPKIKQHAGEDWAHEAKLKASEAGVFARKGDFPRAFALLEEAEQLARHVPDPPVSEDQLWQDLEREWRAVRDGRKLLETLAGADGQLAERLSDLCERGDLALEQRRDLKAARELLSELQTQLSRTEDARSSKETEQETDETNEGETDKGRTDDEAGDETDDEDEDGDEEDDKPEDAEGELEDDPAAQLQDTLDRWTTVRTQVVAQLAKLEQALRGSQDSEADAAIILVKAIQANLTALPDTSAKVAELERYLTTDSIIAEAERPNGFGVRVSIRRPLMAVLDELKSRLSA